MRNRLFFILGVAGLVSLACSGGAAPADPASRADLAAIRAAMDKVTPLFQIKGKPQPGDWLEKQPEKGQTFDQYLKSNPNRITAARTTIYIQPLGTFSGKEQLLLDATVDLVGRMYNVPVKRLEPIKLDAIPAKARRVNSSTHKEQLLTEYILNDLLPPRRPADAVALLALTTSDLWPGRGWNFVFGEASLTERVGVWSSARYGDPNAGDQAYQTLFVANVQGGHP